MYNDSYTIPIYGQTVKVCVGTLDELKQFIEENVEESENLTYQIRKLNGCVVSGFTSKNRDFDYIYFIEEEFSDDLSIIMHEITHLGMTCLDDVNVYFSGELEHQEVLCYLIEELVNGILPILYEYIPVKIEKLSNETTGDEES